MYDNPIRQNRQEYKHRGEVMIEANDKETITATGGSLTGQDVGDTYTGAKLTVTYDVIDGITGHTDTATCNGKFE